MIFYENRYTFYNIENFEYTLYIKKMEAYRTS